MMGKIANAETEQNKLEQIGGRSNKMSDRTDDELTMNRNDYIVLAINIEEQERKRAVRALNKQKGVAK